LWPQPVSKHFDEHGGRLGVWGSIQRYLFDYVEDVQLVIYPDGSVQQEMKASAEPRAELQYSGGKSL
jgi:DNA-binding transcriptional regulator of glucitol operon